MTEPPNHMSTGAWRIFFAFLAAVIVGLIVWLAITLTNHGPKDGSGAIFELTGQNAQRWHSYVHDDVAHGVDALIDQPQVASVRARLCKANPQAQDYVQVISSYLASHGGDESKAQFFVRDRFWFIVNFCDSAVATNQWADAANQLGLNLP